jgi:hypothetical protein
VKTQDCILFWDGGSSGDVVPGRPAAEGAAADQTFPRESGLLIYTVSCRKDERKTRLQFAHCRSDGKKMYFLISTTINHEFFKVA